MPYHWLDFTPPQPQIAAAPVEDFVTAAHTVPLGQKAAHDACGEALRIPPVFGSQ